MAEIPTKPGLCFFCGLLFFSVAQCGVKGPPINRGIQAGPHKHIDRPGEVDAPPPYNAEPFADEAELNF